MTSLGGNPQKVPSVTQKNSNENQRADDASYRFEDFELKPKQRLLTKNGTAAPMPPKSFDALLCLASKLVRAKDLTAQRSLDSMEQARGLLWICIAENPAFAPAWAWLGIAVTATGALPGGLPDCRDCHRNT